MKISSIFLTVASSRWLVCHGFAPLTTTPTTTLVRALATKLSMTAAVAASEKSQLAQLAGMTTLSIDSGDLKVIESYAKTGYITDATTNPLFVSQAGLSGDPVYAEVGWMESYCDSLVICVDWILFYPRLTGISIAIHSMLLMSFVSIIIVG